MKIHPLPRWQAQGSLFQLTLLRALGDQLIANGRVIRGYLGIEMRPARGGIRVRRILRDAPAYLGGLRRNDIIFEYNGNAVKKVVELQMLVAESQVGERSVIKVLRQGHERILNVTIGEMPPELAGQTVEIKSVAWEILGLSVRKLQAGDFERYTYLTNEDQGVIVEMVKVDAPGYKAKDTQWRAYCRHQ